MESRAHARLARLIRERGYARIARDVDLSEGAVRHHAKHLRDPSDAARVAYELVGILRSDWLVPATPTPAPSAPPAAPPVEAEATILYVSSRITPTAGRDVLAEALTTARELFARSVGWALRDRIAVLNTQLAALRGLVRHEPRRPPTKCPTWSSLRAKLLQVVKGQPVERRALQALIADFEAQSAGPAGAIDLRQAVQDVLTAATALEQTEDIGEREQVSLAVLRVAAGRLATSIEAVDNAPAEHPAYLAFREAAMPLLMKNGKIKARMLAVPIPQN